MRAQSFSLDFRFLFWVRNCCLAFVFSVPRCCQDFFFRFCLTLLPFSVTINQSELIKWWFLFCSEWLLLSVAMFLWPDYFLVWFVFLSNCASSKISKNIILFLLLPSDFDSCLDVDVAVDVPLFFLNISAYLLVVVVVEKLTLQY